MRGFVVPCMVSAMWVWGWGCAAGGKRVRGWDWKRVRIDINKVTESFPGDTDKLTRSAPVVRHFEWQTYRPSSLATHALAEFQKVGFVLYGVAYISHTYEPVWCIHTRSLNHFHRMCRCVYSATCFIWKQTTCFSRESLQSLKSHKTIV